MMVVSVLPCAVQVDLTWVQLDVLLLFKDAVDDGLQHLVQIQHADSLTEKQYVGDVSSASVLQGFFSKCVYLHI